MCPSKKGALYLKKITAEKGHKKKNEKQENFFLEKAFSTKKKKGFALFLDIENFSPLILHSPIVTSINTWSYPTVVLVKVAPLESS